MRKIRETEKAVQFEIEIDLTHVEKNVTRKFWCPKSMIEKQWFIDKKIDEVMAEFRGAGANREDDFANDYGIQAIPDLV